MPAPPLVFHEYEAATAWGYTLRVWQEESLDNRARAVAHCLVRNIRESYQWEKSMEKAEAKSRKPDHPCQSYAALMRSMGL